MATDIKEFSKGAYIYLEGAENEGEIFIIREGRVGISREVQVVDDPPPYSGRLGPGDVFNAVATMAGRSKYLETAKVLSDVVTLQTVPKSMFCQDTQLAKKIVTLFSSWTRHLNEALAGVGKESGENQSDAEYAEQPDGPRPPGVDATVKQVRSYPKDARIFSEGSEGRELFIIQSGLVKIVRKAAGGNEIVLSVLTPGRIFGEIALFDPSQRRTATAIACEECRLIALSMEEFHQMTQKQRHIIEYLACQQAGRILHLYGQLANVRNCIYDTLFTKLEEELGDLSKIRDTMHTFAFGINELVGMAGLPNDGNIDKHREKLLQNMYIGFTEDGRLRVMNIQKLSELVVSLRKKAERESRRK